MIGTDLTQHARYFTSFLDFMRDKIGSNWVIARRTRRIVARYGENVVCLSPQKYDRLRAEFDREEAARDAR